MEYSGNYNNRGSFFKSGYSQVAYSNLGVGLLVNLHNELDISLVKLISPLRFSC